MKPTRAQIVKRTLLLIVGATITYAGLALLQSPGVWLREYAPWQSNIGQMLVALGAIVTMFFGIGCTWLGLSGRLPPWLGQGKHARR
jgi:hypothetical protein